ncbi:ABC transporter ATP-binding protein [Castellaniella sp. GW247-6E4]|uniref:ABC transporter ATP-binding protein n=1 Tax=Castellaniella sp. GW247-6E4 TaxID=3140380 RepID=UPI0033162430
MKKAIEFEGISKKFSTKQGIVTALQDVSFEVAEHEFVAVVGTSGCGKSTLLRILGGLVPASNGAVRIDGKPVQGPVSEIGIVFQTPVLLPWRSVRRNIELPLDIRKLDRQQYADEISKLISLVGLEGFEERSPYELSGGMQQRVALCRALIHQPSLLLMDEPFGALDAMTREAMNMEVQRIWMETKKTIMLVTHSISEAVFLADRVIVMTSRPGQVREIVPVDLERPRTFASMKSEVYHNAVGRVRKLLNAQAMTE